MLAVADAGIDATAPTKLKAIIVLFRRIVQSISHATRNVTSI